MSVLEFGGPLSCGHHWLPTCQEGSRGHDLTCLLTGEHVCPVSVSRVKPVFANLQEEAGMPLPYATGPHLDGIGTEEPAL